MNNKEYKPNDNNDSVRSAVKSVFSKKWVWYVIIGLAASIIMIIAVSSILSSVAKYRKHDSDGGGNAFTIPPINETHVEIKKINLRITDVLNQSKLSVITVPFEGMVEWNHDEDKVGYIYYEGEIKLGVDFSATEVQEPENGIVTINLPKIEITSLTTDKSTFKYIYTNKDMKKKYSDQAYELEAYYLCNENIKDYINSETNSIELAENYVCDLVRAMTDPILESEGLQSNIVFKGAVK